MSYILESEFNKIYDELSDINDELEVFNNPIINKETGETINTTAYFALLKNFIADNKRHPKTNEEIHIHHIWPKCIGGKDIDSNKVALTYKQHLEAHKTLADNNLDQPKLLQAVGILSHGFADLTEEERKRYHTALFKYLSKTHGAEGNPNYGVGHTKETRDLLRQKSGENNKAIIVTYKDNISKEEKKVEYKDRDSVAKAIGIDKDLVKYYYIAAQKNPDYKMEPRKVPWDSNIEVISITREHTDPLATSTEAIPIIGIQKNTGKKVPEDAEYFTSSNKAAIWVKKHGYNGIEAVEDMKNDIRDDARISPEQVLKQNRIPEHFGYYWLQYDNATPEYLDWVIQYAKQPARKPDINKIKEISKTKED